MNEATARIKINKLLESAGWRFGADMLINAVPAVQMEPKILCIIPRRAIKQIVEYKNDPGNDHCEAFV